MALYQVLYWKDIPAQVKVFTEGQRSRSRQMPPRYQEQIDARAMQEGLFGTDDYLQHWRWSEKRERDLPAEELLDAIVRELEQDHTARR
jgi:cvfA/B/C family virulence factor